MRALLRIGVPMVVLLSLAAADGVADEERIRGLCASAEFEQVSVLAREDLERLRAESSVAGWRSGDAERREAKRWLRDYRDEQGESTLRHPFYWSAFVLIGDGA